MRILLTGGGTGGHIYPALAVADEIMRRHPQAEILYVGTKRGLESGIVPKKGYAFKTIEVESLPRKINPALFKAVAKALKGCREAKEIIRDFQPDVVLGTGGYVCGPVVLEAHSLKIPTVIHEQNAFPGVTNKLLARMVDQVLLNFASAEKYFKSGSPITVTGLPVRSEVLAVSREEGLAYFGLQKEKRTLLVSGGSRGAKSINFAMAKSYGALLQDENLQIIHSTGTKGYEETLEAIKSNGIRIEEYSDRVKILPYVDHMEYALNAADLTIARAGATNLAEIMACGLASILVPFPLASENHQKFNAESLVNVGAAEMILDKDLDEEVLVKKVKMLLEDEDLRLRMGNNSKAQYKEECLDMIVDLLEKYFG